MSKKQWMVLLMLFLAYLLLGASIFYHIESAVEVEQINKAKQERIEINALLHQHYMPRRTENQHEILEKLTRYCGKSVYNYTEGESDPQKWDFYNSFYFAYTVVSTIGYGNLAPTNMLSRILMIFYGLVGIPMNGILLTQLGEFFGHVFVRAHKKYKSYKHEQNDYYCKKLETRKAGLVMQIFVYLLPGFMMFIFFPAFLFSHYEGWDYDESVYYAFVTLTTIGFGDYVAGQDNSKGNGVFFILYKLFLICWISFGLGYIVMIMTFIARGMRSKKIVQLEHKLAMNLKHTQSKIWNEFNKEVNYLRRVFNELQLSKVKRVYVDENDYETPPAKFPRSNSFPDLRDLVYGGLEIPAPPHPRRRANSEVVPMEAPLTRVVSETDLQRIDKNATFAAHAMVQPAELLARLVNILGYIPPPPDDVNDSDWEGQQTQQQATEQAQEQDRPFARSRKLGVDGFAAKEILANENSWSGFPASLKPRSRATSEVRLQESRPSTPNISHRNSEWTWSGPAASRKIQEMIKSRKRTLSGPSLESKPRKFPSLGLPISMPKIPFPRWRKQSGNKRDADVGEEEAEVPDNNLSSQTLTSADRNDSFSRRFYFTHTGGANLPNLLEGNNLLEETSLADFLRALTSVHARVGAVPDELVRKPQRKLGTASLTPPKLPSLFTLFSQHNPASANQSNQSTFTAGGNAEYGRPFADDLSNYSVPSYYRRKSIVPSLALRRFSLRPVATPNGTPPYYGSPRLSNRRMSSAVDQLRSPSGLLESYGDSSTKPLVQMESGPGVSSPITFPASQRRFSLRPAQIGVPPAPAGRKFVPVHTAPFADPIAAGVANKAIPRWKAGMLQRQIGRRSVRRRERAFSLSDVQTPGRGERSTDLSPLAMDLAMRSVTAGLKEKDREKFVGRASDAGPVQKTVTIVPPTSPSRPSDSPTGPMSFRDDGTSGRSSDVHQGRFVTSVRYGASDLPSRTDSIEPGEPESVSSTNVPLTTEDGRRALLGVEVAEGLAGSRDDGEDLTEIKIERPEQKPTLTDET